MTIWQWLRVKFGYPALTGEQLLRISGSVEVDGYGDLRFSGSLSDAEVKAIEEAWCRRHTHPRVMSHRRIGQGQ